MCNARQHFRCKTVLQYSSWLGECKRNCNSSEDCNECEAYCNCRGDCNKCKNDCTCSGSGSVVVRAGVKQFLHHHNSNTHWELHERKTKRLQTGLEIDWKYGMTGDEHKACAEVISNHFQRWHDPESARVWNLKGQQSRGQKYPNLQFISNWRRQFF